MRGFLRYVWNDSKLFLRQGAIALGVGAICVFFIWILDPFEYVGQIILLAVLEGAGGILAIWLLYAIIEYIRYRRIR